MNPSSSAGTLAQKTVGRLSVGAKIYLSFGCILVLLAAVVGVSLLAQSSLGSAHRKVTQGVLPQVLAADEARAASADMHFSQTRYVLLPSLRNDFLADRSVYQADLKALQGVTAPSLRPALDGILAANAKWQGIDRRLWAAVRAGDSAAARTLVSGVANDASDELVAAFTTYQQKARLAEKRANASFNSTKASSTTTALVLGAAALLVALGLAYLLARALVGGVRQMLAAADGIAGGDVNQDVNVQSQDELGETAAAFRRMIAYLRRTAEAARRIAEGDLTVAVEPESERDALGNAFAEMTTNLRDVIGQVAAATSTLGSASSEMAASSEQAGRAVAEIAEAVGHVARGADRQLQMAETARATTEETGKVAERTAVTAENGVAAAEQANTAMDALRDSTTLVTATIQQLATKSEEIGSIVETITGIAAQTNLLALNAAIEAARAGEQGRGFAVVADEVRKLAEDSNAAARTIAGLIHEIQAGTEETVGAVEEGARRTAESIKTVDAARSAFVEIGASVRDMSDRIVDIVEAAAEVAAVAQQSSASTQEVSAATEETSVSAEQIASSARDLEATVEGLSAVVERFKLVA